MACTNIQCELPCEHQENGFCQYYPARMALAVDYVRTIIAEASECKFFINIYIKRYWEYFTFKEV